MFVFTFAFWGVIHFAIHSNLRLTGDRRRVSYRALLALLAVSFVAAYYLPDHSTRCLLTPDSEATSLACS